MKQKRAFIDKCSLLFYITEFVETVLPQKELSPTVAVGLKNGRRTEGTLGMF